ncbi:hypothetical protein VA7868_04380 [Vibrio aerogenes CECT 7868]|uniref:Uncharacterized protein n=2 Tax=Vibrio aerogenes TaxID=92172 RepID=A0A1M6E1L9_9VIBR|nr:hypothetical protein [Vibrio aerogenes]SHI79280.1 hypothetical protein VA7868_04380 [Vibrio aerogenes CECT 7868]
MILVDKHDAITLKVSHAMSNSKSSHLDIYLFIPGEINLNKDVISETDFFYNCISQKRAYYSDKILLPLIHSRLAQRGRLSSKQYRVSLSLYAYQYVIALDKAVSDLSNHGDTVTSEEIDHVIKLSLDILRRLRRTIPYEETLKRYYANIDNYLSWYTEQKFLALVAHLNRDQDYKTIKNRLITLAEKEQAHRALNHYNSAKADEDITRLSNKMRLLRRLIEHPVILKENVISLGNNVKRVVKGTATGFIMLFVTFTVISARNFWGEITVSFLIAMSFIYALREIFKDDLKSMLWRWLRKGKPKWKRRYQDPNTGKIIGQKLEWLDYQPLSSIPDRIQKIRKKRIVQREEQILRYQSETQMSTSRFMSGYEETKETILIDFREITRLFDKNTNRIYRLSNGQVSKEKVEKRHLINLIVKENNFVGQPTYYRWKIVLNRSKIVAIEPIELEEELKN